MPIQTKTMRDIWDSKRKKNDCNPAAASSHSPLRSEWVPKETEKNRNFPLEIEKYYLEHLTRKKAFFKTKDEIAKIFADYENRIGNAGFSRAKGLPHALI